MKAEAEGFEVTAGLDGEVTNGGPLAFYIRNSDSSGKSRTPEGEVRRIEFPRPGHVDLAAAQKWKLSDVTSAVELASGRVTAAYTLAGAACAMLLREVGIFTLAHVVQVGNSAVRVRSWRKGVKLPQFEDAAHRSKVLALDEADGDGMLAEITAAAAVGDTVGGVFEVVCAPVPPGLGASQPLWERIDSRLTAAIMGIPAVRAVGIGNGMEAHQAPGSRFHDPIAFSKGRGFVRKSNNAGGIEGGITNGEPVVVKAVVKPVPTLDKPLPSVSLVTMDKGPAQRIRSDVCVVAPAAVAARALTAFVLADAVLSATGGDLVAEVCKNVQDRFRT